MADDQNTVLLGKSSAGITTICINRSSRRNAVDGPTAQKLHAAFLSFDNDPTQKICVFHSSGGVFCAGADLQEVAKISSPENQQSQRKVDVEQSKSSKLLPVDGTNPAPMGPSRMTLSKPVIAAVSGFAVAGGLELSLLADMRIVEEDAVFGVFCRRFGVPLIDGGTVRLQRIVGLGRAMDMILTGRAVTAQEALGMGLANRVVAKGQAFQEAMALARTLLKFPQRCMNVDRKSVYYAAYEARGFEDAMRFEFENGKAVVMEESVKGAARFRDGVGRHGKFDLGSKL
ncbi:ClpP/crotonase-like domain-containing protein [Talaromyces proteolyticus]|uniref:ClpP/crotonase-like domain-containing protein n=1 Tax=Talaromyces proteolyticus TaxID=1131652 RepID=A0AAD4KYG8_9EURO|nr:ClpP/crotonase-like domain-containing protein [Talaromyces proteolyticus]KAH8703870.1 ClpP/crotonase-like domain-containing protein [Talaromyces proteolyticus]